MKVVNSILLAALVLAALLGTQGCSASTSDVPADRPAVRISGSDPSLELLKQLAAVYPHKDDVRFVFLEGVPSSGGVLGVRDGAIDIGAVSRTLEGPERLYGLRYVPLATDAIAFGVHPGVGIDTLTVGQLRDIYSGRIDNWRELGGPDLPIVAIDLASDNSAKDVLTDDVFSGVTYSDGTVILSNEGDVHEAIARTPGAIGYFSAGHAMVDDARVALIAIRGVKPSLDSLSAHTYRLSRELAVVTGPHSNQEARKFIEWAIRQDAARAMEKAGYAPMNTAGDR